MDDERRTKKEALNGAYGAIQDGVSGAFSGVAVFGRHLWNSQMRALRALGLMPLFVKFWWLFLIEGFLLLAFRASFTKAKDAAGIKGRTFHDLRGTAVTRLAVAGCTVPEIATITGHDLKAVETILSKHYLGRVQALGDSAIAKLEKHRSGTPSVNGPVNGSGGKAANDT